MPRPKSPDIDSLLANWEEVYKKGLLSFWLLLYLHDRPAYAYEASSAIAELSQGTVSADENSMYRALNRFESLGILKSDLKPSAIGPARRYYQLSDAGKALLARFTERNILIFQSPAVADRIASFLNTSKS
ncbi:MAG TPA: PadR family transcriptional regulator [Anaerolineales bacterium]|nr:PadR family transcriptional regulator [Anaerolineales bacterium]